MPRTSSRKRKAADYHDEASEVDEHQTRRTASKALPAAKDKTHSGSDLERQAAKKERAKRHKTETDKDAATPAKRTNVSSLQKAMYIGAHVSASGGVQNAVTNARQIGANSFALFLKSQRKWSSPALTAEAKNGFINQCDHHGYSANDHALPHGSYLVNLAQADIEKSRQAYDSFLDDLQRCEQLGIKLYNFHPGSTGGDTKEAAIRRIALQLNKSHKATKTVITVLENMAGAGNVVGSTWEDLRDIITLVDDKERVGVCIDTCHAFSAGYDLRTPEVFRNTMDSFNEVVGAKYLKAFHLNDSKAPFNSHRDLHANIGTGFLGLRAFHNIMNDEQFQGMPMVLETPIDRKGSDGKKFEDKAVWAEEIKLLESLIGMDADTKKFHQLVEKLQAEGAEERDRIQDQVNRKVEKDAKKGKLRGKGK